MAVAGSIAWQHRYRLAPRLARAYAAELGAQLLRAVPDGYVTKNRERVIASLDAFTNGVARGQVSKADIDRVTSLLFAGLADGRLSYQELDRVIEAMDAAAFSHPGVGRGEVR